MTEGVLRLDGTFGSDGNGKIVVLGHANGEGGRFALAGFRATGTLDTAFGGDGKVATKFTGGGAAGAVAIQADGKIVAAGDAGGNDGRFALARYNADGTLDTCRREDRGCRNHGPRRVGPRSLQRGRTLDTTFDVDGKVTTDVTTEYDSLAGVAIQADGRIVAAGSALEVGDTHAKVAVARYLA